MPNVKHVAREGKSGKTMNFIAPTWMVCVAIVRLSCMGATNDLALGEVRVNPSALAISFPAELNQRTGLVEYLVVHESGKVHESIFKTKIGAQQIHTAALLFADKNSTNALPKIKTIQVAWNEKKFDAAELILDKKKNRALRETKWGYRGSRLVEGIFLAQRDGSIIAIMEDRDALVDQATPDASDDENWQPLTENLPAVGTPVTITVNFDRPRT
jgi:hypothetical protein